MDSSPTSTQRPPLSSQMSSVPSTPQSSAPPSPKQPFFGYRDERAHLTVSLSSMCLEIVALTRQQLKQDAGAFHAELPTAIPPDVVAASAGARGLTGQPSIERLSLSGLAIVGSTSSPDVSTPTPARARTMSDASARAKGDLTSPRIANLALRGSPGKPTSTGRPLNATGGKDGFLPDPIRTGQVDADHGAPHLNPELEDAEEIDEGFTARE